MFLPVYNLAQKWGPWTPGLGKGPGSANAVDFFTDLTRLKHFFVYSLENKPLGLLPL